MTYSEVEKVRAYIRVGVGLVIVVGYVALLVTGNPSADKLLEKAPVLLGLYAGLDGSLYLYQARNGNAPGK